MSPKWGIPANAVLASLVIMGLLSLINLGSLTALNAMFTLTTGSLLASYLLSISCVLYKRLRGDALPPRQWTLGRYGMAINIVALLFLLVFFVWSFFPVVHPVELSTMNWGALIFIAVMLLSTVYYLIWGKHAYITPLERLDRSRLEGGGSIQQESWGTKKPFGY